MENRISPFLKYFSHFFHQGIAKNLEKPSIYSESLRPSGDGGAYFNDYMNWRQIEEFEELVWKSPAARIAGQLMGSATTSVAICPHNSTRIRATRVNMTPGKMQR